MNSVYLVPADPATFDPPLPGGWHAHGLPGDPLNRWVLVIEHPDDATIAALAKMPAVVALPHVLSGKPVGLAVAAAATRLNAASTDTTYDFLEKLRAAGWPMARHEW